MLWGYKQLDDWNSQVKGKKFSNVLAFNEPDQSGQSAMSVGSALSLWKQAIQPMHSRKGSPAVTSSPAGLAWLDSFLSQCHAPDCTVDFVTIHHYGMDEQVFISMIETLYNKHKKPIWVTEWACQNYGSNQNQQCDQGKVASFLSTTQSWLDSTNYVERYAWFGPLTNWDLAPNFNQKNGLLSKSKSLSALGHQYISW